MIFDSHAHLDDDYFKDKLDDTIKLIKAAGIDYIVNPGCDIDTSLRAIEISSKYGGIYPAVGYHPSEIYKYVPEDMDKLEKMSQTGKVVAIGEIGLDYHYEGYDKRKQAEVFVNQIYLAEKLSLPIIIHSRDASMDTYEILKSHKKTDSPCVLHCFSQSRDMAKKYLDIGCHLSFAGPVTFTNSKNLQETAKYVPLEYMFIETDSPYLAPHPHRGEKNTPVNVKLVGQKIARLKNISDEEVFETTAKNALKFFNIKL